MVGVGGLLSVEHKTSGKGRIYSNIKGIAPIPKQMKALPLPTLDGYERPSYYTERKAQYAKEAAEFRAKIGAPRPVVDDFGSEPFEDDDSGDLPF